MNLAVRQGQEGIFLPLRMDAIGLLFCCFVLVLCLLGPYSVKCTFPS